MRTKRSSGARVSEFAGRLLTAWDGLMLPKKDASVVVAVSGGADSSALILALDELTKAQKLSVSLIVAHLDHSLRKASRADSLWVEALAESLGYECVRRRIDVKKRAVKSGDNLEQSARKTRYEFLKQTAKEKGASVIVTAHTLDDQAETILMRLLRGSAAEGLTGMEPVRQLDSQSEIMLARPLVSWVRRLDAEDYCRSRGVDFRVDEMNQNERFSRVKVRKQLLPLMESFNNRVVEALARTASLLREDAGVLANEADKLLDEAGRTQSKTNKTKAVPLNVHVLAAAPAAVRRRALRQWILRGRGDLRRLEMVHFTAVDCLVEGNRGRRIAELPGGARVLRNRGWLELDPGPKKKSG